MRINEVSSREVVNLLCSVYSCICSMFKSIEPEISLLENVSSAFFGYLLDY